MVDRKRSKQKLSIIYEEAPNRPILPVGGAIGASSPDGSTVVAHLYNEFVTVPTVAQHEISPGGVIDLSKGVAERRGDLTRLILATLVLSPETAIRLGNFLIKQAGRAMEQRKENQPKPDKS